MDPRPLPISRPMSVTVPVTCDTRKVVILEVRPLSMPPAHAAMYRQLWTLFLAMNPAIVSRRPAAMMVGAARWCLVAAA